MGCKLAQPEQSVEDFDAWNPKEAGTKMVAVRNVSVPVKGLQTESLP